MTDLECYELRVKKAREDLKEATAALSDARTLVDTCDRHLAEAEHELDEYLQEKMKLDAETRLPQGAVLLNGFSACEAIYQGHVFRVSPPLNAGEGPHRWLLVVSNDTGCILQQWSDKKHDFADGAIREAMERVGVL